MFPFWRWLFSLLTFPGVILHEFAHKRVCRLYGIPVYKMVYFRFGNPAGYVLHGDPDNYRQRLGIALGPLILNSFLAILLGFLVSWFKITDLERLILIWLAISVGMHSFPSNQDMANILAARRFKNGGYLFYFLALPFIGLIWLANKLRFAWFDLWYALILIYLGSRLAEAWLLK